MKRDTRHSLCFLSFPSLVDILGTVGLTDVSGVFLYLPRDLRLMASPLLHTSSSLVIHDRHFSESEGPKSRVYSENSFRRNHLIFNSEERLPHYNSEVKTITTHKLYKGSHRTKYINVSSNTILW